MGARDEDSINDEPVEPHRTDVTLKLMPKTDRAGHTYHIARCDAPILLDLRECTIFVFTGDNPEISIRRTRSKIRPRPGREE